MFKKLLVVFVGIMLLLLLMVSFTGKRIKQVANVNYDNINKIVFYDGRGGRNKPITLEDKEKIKEFMNYLNEYTIRKVKNPEKTGWIHSAVLYDNYNKEMKITFGSPIEINGEYYKVLKGDLSTDKIDKFLNSIDSSWQTSSYIPAVENIALETNSKDMQVISKQIMVKYFDELKGDSVAGELRITDYTINKVNAIQGNSDKFNFFIVYSLKPADKSSYVLAGNGEIKDSWIVNKNAFVEVELRGKKYWINSMGTGK
jgi:hypothetical protein